MKKKKKLSKIVSLEHIRKEQNKKARKAFLSPQERIGELEQDVLRLVEFSLELEERLNSQASFIRKLLDRLRRHLPDASGED